jgi:hypothetical protein
MEFAMLRRRLIFLGLLLTPLVAWPAQNRPTLDSLAPPLQNLIQQSLPATLYEEKWNWGHTTRVPHAVHWHGRGLKVRPEVIKTDRNDGTWRQIKVTPRDLKETLVFKLSDLKQSGADQLQFNAYLSFMVGVDYDQQVWESGVRLYAGSVRARLRVHLPLVLEATMRFEQGKSIIPDTVFRIRVLKSDLRYDQLVVEHIGGIGGTGAKVLGETLHSAVKQIKPNLERDLLAKANAAIVKAGDTKEIRIGLGSLFETKKQ